MANFPGSVSTNSNLYIAVNGVQTTLAASILATDTTIQLTSSTGFPTTGFVTIDNSEVVSYTGISGPNLTGCTRGADGTVAAPHSLGVTVGATIVAAHHNLLKDEIIAVETALGAGYAQASANTPGAVVQRDGSGNFSAGTITAALNGNASTATKATNIAGGAAGEVPYQSASDTTGFSPAGTSGDLLQSGGAGAPSWTTPSSAATASAVMKRDANANVKVNTVIENFATTVTAAGTTALTAASAPIQQFTGTSTQTVTLPDCTTLSVGYQITVLNRSTGAVTVNNSGGSLQSTVAATNQAIFTCTNTGSANGTWDVSTSSAASGGTVTNVSGTTDQITVTNPTTTPTLSLAATLALWRYRRPNLQWATGTTVQAELGLDGTSGDATVLFPDGQLRAETGSNRYTMTITQNAVFNDATLGNNKGGLRTGSAVNNTWYACYAVKVTTFSANWVLVADTVLNKQSNFSTLNSNFGTNGWVYLGLIRYGDNNNFPSSIVEFVQTGSVTIFGPQNGGTNYGGAPSGIQMVSTASVSTVTYTRTAGTGSTDVPDNIGQVYWVGEMSVSGSGHIFLVQPARNGTPEFFRFQMGTSDLGVATVWVPANDGFKGSSDTTGTIGLYLQGFMDGVLGVGSNPLL